MDMVVVQVSLRWREVLSVTLTQNYKFERLLLQV